MKGLMEEEGLEKQSGEEWPVRRKIRGHTTGGECAEGAVCMRESVYAECGRQIKQSQNWKLPSGFSDAEDAGGVVGALGTEAITQGLQE